MSLSQKFKDFIGYQATQDNSKMGSALDSKVIKKTIVPLGTMRAGKTTYLSALGATAQYRASESAKADAKFRFIPREGHTNLLDDIAELRSGHFPPATPIITNSVVKPAYAFEWEDPTFFGGSHFTVIRQADLQVLDYAGEQLVQLMHKVRAAKTLEQGMAIEGTDQLTSTVNQCSALLPIINAERAEGLPIFKPDPYDKIKGMSKHPDVNLQRMLGPIIEYKHDNRQYCPPLERIGIVITACDLLFPIAKTIANITGRPFDPLNPEISNASLDTFMKAFFPGTHSLISSLRLNVQYFPSFFETEGYWDPETKTDPKIKRGNIFDSPDWEHNVNRPRFSEYWYNRAIDWTKELATRV